MPSRAPPLKKNSSPSEGTCAVGWNGAEREAALVEQDDREPGGSGDERGEGGGRRRFIRRARVCQFCADQTKFIDHKQVDLLKRNTAENGRIRSRRETGTCARHQRMLATAVKRARHLALIPFRAERAR